MQKVITITSQTNLVIRRDDEPFIEITYPNLDKCLEEGYVIIQAIPIITSTTTSGYSITFILEKKEKGEKEE